MDAVTALPSLARGMLDGVTRHIGLILGTGQSFVYPPSWVSTFLPSQVFNEISLDLVEVRSIRLRME